jgi:lysyl-tRNA synthetase, class II
LSTDGIERLEQQRQEKANKLRELGVDPYGSPFEAREPATSIKARFKDDTEGQQARCAGRIVLLRDIGKLMFLSIRDSSGDIQIGLSKSHIASQWDTARLLELGDIIGVEGELGRTRTGEITVWGKALTVLSKSILPPPEKWHGLADVDMRYRQRYVDLWANPESMELSRKRIAIVDAMRQFLKERGFLEVETPMMQAVAGGAAARPFTTHHNALDMELFLRIAPELYLKRLLVGGMEKVFEINRNFRNEGLSPRHNPEFTMLEAYQAYGSWETMAELVESMICQVAQSVFGTLKIEHKNADGSVRKTIDLGGDASRPAGSRWRRARMTELVEERTGWKFDKTPLQDACPAVMEKLVGKGGAGDSAQGSYAKKLAGYSPAEQLVEVYEKLIEPTLTDPCFVTHLPSVTIPLARENREDAYFADVYELAINGQEISPGYSELNDPLVQEKHFRNQVGEDQQKMDEDFITALKYGMPPAGGMGLGVDRLVMMLTGAESIRDVILFPLLKSGS